MALFFVSSISSCDHKAEEASEHVAESTFDMTTAKAEIEAANKEFMTFFAAGDSVNLANLYTDDAKFMSEGAPSITGKQNIATTFSGFMKSGITRADLSTVEVWGTEDFISEEGAVSLYVGEDQVYQGKYIVLWKKDDGKWKLFRDIFNSDSTPE